MRPLRHTYSTRILVVLFLSLGATACALAQGSAQPEGWKMLDLGLNSGLATGLELPSPGTVLYYRDSLVGYYNPTTELTPNTRTTYRTSDGGITWQPTPNPVPIPFSINQNGFGTSPGGFTTEDNGATWKPVVPAYRDLRLGWEITSTIANSVGEVAVGYQARTYDTSRKIFLPVGPIRLAYTLDSGTTWTFADSLVIDTISGSGSIRYELHDTTLFGVIPTPSGMSEVFSRGWSQIESFRSGTTIRVVAAVYGRVGTIYQTRYYLGSLDLTTRRATWELLPFREALPGESIRPEGVRFVGSSFAYVVQSRDPFTTPRFVIWRSFNQGASWDTVPAPATIDFATFRFVDDAFGASANAITRDTGRTWKMWAHPFESATFFPLDSTHFYMASRNGLTARSNDAGRNWQRNASGGLPRSIVAHRGMVIVGRNYGSLLRSADEGDTWTDVGLDGGLPDRLAVVWSLSFVDTLTSGKSEIRGVGSFIEYDGRTYYASIISNDSGLTWTKGIELPQLNGAGSTINMTFARFDEADPVGLISSSKGILASLDRGLTWSVRDTLPLRSLEMASLTHGIGTTLDGIYTTTNTGVSWTKVQTLTSNRNRPVGLRAFSSIEYRGLFPDRTQLSKTWDRATTTGSATTWSVEERTGAPLPLDGYGYWIDQNTIYTVGRGATVQASTDGGATFVTKQDSVGAFKGTSGWVVAASDSTHYYVIGAGNVAGRWSFFEKPPVGVRGSQRSGSESSLRIATTADGDAIVRFGVDRPTTPRVEIHDMLGRVLESRLLDLVSAGEHAVGIPTSELGSGTYMLSLVIDGTRTTRTFVVTR